MTFEEKHIIATTALKLMDLLMNCDDCDFVDLVLDCVAAADSYPLENL